MGSLYRGSPGSADGEAAGFAVLGNFAVSTGDSSHTPVENIHQSVPAVGRRD